MQPPPHATKAIARFSSFEREGELQYTPFYSEQPKALVFQFVKKDRGLSSFIQNSIQLVI